MISIGNFHIFSTEKITAGLFPSVNFMVELLPPSRFLAGEEPCLGLRGLSNGTDRLRIPLQDEDLSVGAILVWFLAFHVCGPRSSWNGSGLSPCLWVQDKNIWFRQSTKNATICPIEFPGHSLSQFAFYLF